MNGVIRFKGKANAERPDNFSGVIIKPYRGGNRVTGSLMNSTVTLGFLIGHFHFAIGEFLLSSELPHRGILMLLIWWTVGLMFSEEVVEILIK